MFLILILMIPVILYLDKMEDYFICFNTGFIIMEKFDGVLLDILIKYNENLFTSKIDDTFTNKIMNNITTIINKMHNTGVIHNDLHSKNIVYKINNKNEYKFAIIDFGLSSYFKNKNDLLDERLVSKISSIQLFYPPFDYFILEKSIHEKVMTNIFYMYLLNNKQLHPADYLVLDKWYYDKQRINFNFVYKSIKNYIKNNKSNIKSYIKDSYLEKILKNKYSFEKNSGKKSGKKSEKKSEKNSGKKSEKKSGKNSEKKSGKNSGKNSGKKFGKKSRKS